MANAAYPDLRLTDLANSLRDGVATFAKTPGDEARRGAVGALLGTDAATFATAAAALDARANAAIASGDDSTLAATYAQLRAAENAFFEPQEPAWKRTLLYDIDGYQSGVLPTLKDTLGPNGDAALATLHAAFKAATAAAASQ